MYGFGILVYLCNPSLDAGSKRRKCIQFVTSKMNIWSFCTIAFTFVHADVLARARAKHVKICQQQHLHDLFGNFITVISLRNRHLDVLKICFSRKPASHTCKAENLSAWALKAGKAAKQIL